MRNLFKTQWLTVHNIRQHSQRFFIKSTNSDIHVTMNQVYPESYKGLMKFLDIVTIFYDWK